MIAAGLHIVSQSHSERSSPQAALCVTEGRRRDNKGDGLEELSNQRSIEGILS